MKVTFRKEFNLDINMHRLMNDCIDRSNDFFSYYEDLNLLVCASLVDLYDVDVYGYDNAHEIITVVAKNLLSWCLENNYIKEHDQLISGVGRRKS